MHSGIVIGKLSACQTLPEVNVLFTLSIRWLSGHHPGVRSLTVGSDTDVCVQAETQKQVAQKYSMVFGVSTALFK